MLLLLLLFIINIIIIDVVVAVVIIIIIIISEPQISTPVAVLTGTRRYRVISRSGWPNVSVQWLNESASLICNFYLVAARPIIKVDPTPRHTLHSVEALCNQPFTNMCLFVGCLSSQQYASVSQGRISSDNFTCCHTEIEAADQTFHLTQSQYTDTGPTSPSADPITPGAWQGSHWSVNF